MAKIFEVGDVLPQGLVKITGNFYSSGEIFIYLNSVIFMGKSDDGLDFAFESSFDSFLVEDNTDYSSTRLINAIFDFSSLSESERTFNTGYYDGGNAVYWEEYIAGYSVTYEENGGSIVTDLTEQTNLPSPLPTTTKAGHTFVAWYIDSALTTRAVAGATIEEDTTLYAKWHTLGSLFTEIADAIRSKDGTSESIRDVDFGERVNTLPSPKEEETKGVTPNFASGNVVVTPTSGKVMSQVTINKDSNLIANNIKKDVTVHGITGSSFIAIELTQAQYDALATKDANAYYLITG